MSKLKANSLENITWSEMDTSQTQDSLKVMLHGNLVPRAFPSKNGWGHFLREKPWGRGWLHGIIRNDDFQRNPALQCWNNIVTIPKNVATMLQRCVALKIVVADHLV